LEKKKTSRRPKRWTCFVPDTRLLSASSDLSD
jgi:hypothetical protein